MIGYTIEDPHEQIGQQHDLGGFGRIVVFDLTMAGGILDGSNLRGQGVREPCEWTGGRAQPAPPGGSAEHRGRKARVDGAPQLQRAQTAPRAPHTSRTGPRHRHNGRDL